MMLSNGSFEVFGLVRMSSGLPNKYVLFDEIKLTAFTLKDWLGGAAVR